MNRIPQSFGQHAHNRPALLIQANRRAQDIDTPPEAGLPQFVTDQDYGLRSRDAVGGLKQSAQRRTQSQNSRELRRGLHHRSLPASVSILPGKI